MDKLKPFLEGKEILSIQSNFKQHMECMLRVVKVWVGLEEYLSHGQFQMGSIYLIYIVQQKQEVDLRA